MNNQWDWVISTSDECKVSNRNSGERLVTEEFAKKVFTKADTNIVGSSTAEEGRRRW